MTNKYVCVNCNNYVKKLFMRYTPTVLKLHTCEFCRKTADKYIEYDQVIIFIDLVLFNREAYRHVLFNTDFKNHWKLAIIILLLKTYCQWVNLNSHLFGSQHYISTEHSFYLSAIIATLGAFLNVSFLFICVSIYEYYKIRSKPDNDVLLLRWKAIILSNMSWFLILPSLIWKDHIIPINFFFFAIYFIISQTQALSVTCSTPRALLFFILCFSLVLENLSINATENWINKFVMR